MAREQQFNNTQRQVINTIEDTSKYQTPDSRRLRVTSDPLRIYTEPVDSGVTKLAGALSSIKPELMTWAINKQSEDYSRSIEIGKQAAQTGGKASGEMEQFGYDNVKAVNDWTDWNQKVTTEYDQNFDKEKGNLDDFLKQQWESHPFQDKSQAYLDKFTPLAGKTMEKLRTTQGQFMADLQESKNNAELTRMFAGDIHDVMGSGQDYGVAQYEARRDNLKAQFPGKTNSQLDELAYQAVLDTMQKTGDVSLVKVFKQPHSDKTPGLYEIPKWKAKIDEDVHKIIAHQNESRRESDIRNEKALKNAADTTERGILFDVIQANTLADPTDKAEALRGIVAKAQKVSESGIPISDATIKTLMSASTAIDKKEETLYQAQNYNTLRLGNPSVQQIAKAVNSGDISQSGFEKLMNAKDAAANRAASHQGKDKPLSSDPFVKQAFKDIDNHAGYSWASMASGNEQSKKNADAVKERVLSHIEDLVDSGMSPKEAAAKGSEVGIKMLKDAGLESKSFQEANAKLDKAAYKKKDPVGYYTANPKDYIADSKSNTVPVMAPKDLLAIQKEALKAASTKKLKNHESTH